MNKKSKIKKNSFFSGIDNFSEYTQNGSKIPEHSPQIKQTCKCKQRYKTFKKGQLRVSGKHYYVRRFFSPFWAIGSVYWKEVILTINKIEKDKVIPNPDMFYCLKRGFWFSEIYFQIKPKNYNKKQMKKIKTIDSIYYFPKGLFKNDNNIIPNLYNIVRKLMHGKTLGDMFELLIDITFKEKFELWFFCPLCMEDNPRNMGFFF